MVGHVEDVIIVICSEDWLKTSSKKHFKEMNSYVGMTIVKKKNRDKMIISINKAYFLHYQPA